MAVATTRSGLMVYTSAAILLSTVVFAVVFLIVLFLVRAEMWFEPPSDTGKHVIWLFSTGVGSGFGVFAAKEACNAALRTYSGRAVCVFMEIVCAVGLVVAVSQLPFPSWLATGLVVQAVTVAFAASTLFWPPARRRLRRLTPVG